jgi:replicative DNA helicase
VAADNELRMISRAIRDRDITPILKRGITDEWFENEDALTLWRFVKRHYTRYGEVPTAVTVNDNYPTIGVQRTDDTIDFLVDQFVAYRQNAIVHDFLQKALRRYERDHDYGTTMNILSDGLSRAQAVGMAAAAGNDIDLTDDPLGRLQAYKDLAARGGSKLLGHPTGFPTIDEVTGGLQPNQFIVIIAKPKVGKSVLALQIAMHCHKNNLVPWFLSFEMSNHEQQSRHDAFRANISHARLIRGLLNPDEVERYDGMLNRLALQHPFYLADSTSVMTVPAIAEKLKAMAELPDVIFIDGTYFIVDHISGEVNTPRAITNVTRGLKNLAMKLERPIIATTQVLGWKVKAGNVNADSIGYSSSFHQDADVIFALQREDDDQEDKSRLLKVVDGRNCPRMEVELLWDWDAGRFEEYKPDDDKEDEAA